MNGIDQFRQKVKKHGLPKVVAFGGGEQALVDDALEFLRREALAQDSEALNHQKLTAGEHNLDELDSILNTMPFLAKVRVVEVHRAEKINASEVDIISEYIKRPSPSSLLILVFDKVDKRNKFISSLIRDGLMVIFSITHKADLVKMIMNEGLSSAVKINTDAANFLALVLDNDLLAIKSAISKLALLFNNCELSIDAIQEHVVGHGEQDVFILARHISEGKLEDALFGFALLRQNKENALKFLGVLAWQFRTLVHIRHCLDKGLSEHEIQKSVTVFGDRFSWMHRLAKKKAMEFHVGRLTRLLECDSSLKTLNIADPLNIIEKVVYQSVVGL